MRAPSYLHFSGRFAPVTLAIFLVIATLATFVGRSATANNRKPTSNREPAKTRHASAHRVRSLGPNIPDLATPQAESLAESPQHAVVLTPYVAPGAGVIPLRDVYTGGYALSNVDSRLPVTPRGFQIPIPWRDQ